MSDIDPPPVDHRAHVVRIVAELLQIASIIGAAVSLAKTGLSVTSGAAIAVALALTFWLARNPRPPLPGDRG